MLSYNTFGTRLFIVGNNDFPALYEMPRQNLDFAIGKTFLGEQVEVKVGCQGILNPAFRLREDTDRSGEINTGTDRIVQQYRWGRYYTLRLSFTLQ